MKLLKLLSSLFLSLFFISILSAQITQPDSASIATVKDVVATVDSTVTEVTAVVETINNTDSKDLTFWLDLILVILMPLSVKILTRLSRLKSKFNFLFKALKGMSTMAIVILASMLVSGLAETFGFKFLFIDSFGDYFALALSGSVLIYESTKKLFGSTPKKEEVIAL